MGSVQSFETPKCRGGQPGKIDAPLNKKLSEVKWGEFTICDLFNKVNVKSLKYKTSDLPNEATAEFNLPALTAGIQNQGLNNYVPKADATVLKMLFQYLLMERTPEQLFIKVMNLRYSKMLMLLTGVKEIH